jgi:hypothetical protein
MCWRGFLFDSSRRVSARGRRSIGSFDFPFPYATPAGARQVAQQQPAAFPASSQLDSADLGRSADDEDEAVQESGWDFCAVSVIP